MGATDPMTHPPETDPPETDPPVTDPPVVTPPVDGKLAMDECGLKTNFIGDEYCINPPPADQGFQMYIGPTDRDSPEPQYVLEPGRELTENFTVTSGNASPIYYYYRQYRMRPGAHQLIINQERRRIGGSTSTAKDSPHLGMIAPENMDVGMALPAQVALRNHLHYFNSTGAPILIEGWVNFWYRDASVVKQPTIEVYSVSPMNVAPGEHVVISGSCPVGGSGHALTFYPHVHANNLRFSAYRVRGGNREPILDSFDWEHPYVAEYSSIAKNPAANRASRTPGAFSGLLELRAGDRVDIECEIENKTNGTLIGTDAVFDGELCILIGDTVGASIGSGCSYETRPAGATN